MPRVSLSQLTHTGRARDVRGVAQPAVAAEGADAVDALAVLAEVGQHLALVDVCGRKNQWGPVPRGIVPVPTSLLPPSSPLPSVE